MVFLHGYLSSKEAFTAQIEYFSRFFRVTALDFLGFGQSAPLTEPFSVGDYAAWTREVFRLLGISFPRIVAHSFGCRVAIKLLAGGEGCEKLLLTGPAGVILRRGLSYKCKVGAYRLVKKVFPAYAERRFGSAEYRSLPPIMKESYKKIVNEDLRLEAEKIACPTLLVEGEEDRTTPMEAAREYLARIPCCRLVTMRGGHFAFAEYPLAFNLIAEEFLYD